MDVKKKRAAVLFAVILLLAVRPVYAAGVDESIRTFTSGLADIYDRIMVPVGICGAALGIAGSAFKILTGDEEEAEQGRKNMKNVCMALVCLMLLPRVIVWGQSLISQTAWHPFK